MSYAPTNLTDISKYDRNVGGWIAPSGEFYRAGFWQHDAVAARIVDEMSYEVDFPGDFLVKRGWFKLETDGECWHSSRDLTGQQLDVLYWLWCHGGDYYYKRYLGNIIKPHMESICCKETRQLVPGQGDQENINFEQWRQSVYSR